MKILKYILVSILIIVNIIVLENTYAESFSNYSSLAGSADRIPNKKVHKSCKTYKCGPISTIELSIVSSPDVGSKNYDIGENSTFDQLIGLGDDLNKFDTTDVMKQMRDVQNVWGQLGIPSDGTDVKKEIRITIPMIDYGFSGTFNKILISVSEKDKKQYRSTSQGLTSKDDHVEYTGSVTIEKYTPFILKGSYSAPLRKYKPILGKDKRLVGQPNRFCPAFRDPSTPACTTFTLEGTGNISGQFNILSPWRDDDRLKRNIDVMSSHVDPFKHDIKQKMAEMGIDIDVDKEFDKLEARLKSNKNRISGSSNEGGNSSTIGDIYGGCNCSCNFVESATTQCKSSCSAAFAACSGERYIPARSPVVNNNIVNSLFPSPADQAKIKGATLMGIDQKFVNSLENNTVKIPKDLRKKYISLLEKKVPGTKNAAARQMMLMGFDSMPDDKAKMIMLKSAESM